MRRIFFLLATISLAACSAQPVQNEHASHKPTDHADPLAFAVEDRSTDTEIAYVITKGEGAFADYGISHTKRMHLIIVRDDLMHFTHLHPEQDASGTWRIAFTPKAPGTYWAFADFVDSRGAPITLRFPRHVAGDASDNGFAADPGTSVEDEEGHIVREKQTEGYRVRFSTEEIADGLELRYEIFDASGRPAKLETYLGEKGHSVLISRDGDFIHTHPHKEYVGYRETDPPVFVVSIPENKDFYRVFTQFQIKGKVITVAFDWER